jgi:hypothetical protein
LGILDGILFGKDSVDDDDENDDDGKSPSDRAE